MDQLNYAMPCCKMRPRKNLEGEELNQNVGKLIMQDVHMVDDPEKMVNRRSTRVRKRNIKLKDCEQ